MPKANCKCLACKNEYYFCIPCNRRESRPLPEWHLNFCDETCMTVFETVSSYCGGSITKEEADEIISKYDISKKTFTDNIKNKIKEIQKKDTKLSFSKEKEPSSKEPVESSKEDTSVGLMAPEEGCTE